MGTGTFGEIDAGEFIYILTADLPIPCQLKTLGLDHSRSFPEISDSVGANPHVQALGAPS